MGAFKDLTGKRFGRLLVLYRDKLGKDSHSKWACKCDCGNEISVYGINITRGLTSSCGCLHSEITKKIFVTHGATVGERLSEYTSWSQMKARCNNPKTKNYNDYGGRGVTVCARWLESFENFLEDMGLKPTPKHSLDRFPDNETGNYEPSNCRWGTSREQSTNRRSNKWIEYNGERMVQKDWAIRLNVCQHTVKRFLKNGKSIGDIIEHFKDRKTKA